jgi:hypothetical protein
MVRIALQRTGRVSRERRRQLKTVTYSLIGAGLLALLVIDILYWVRAPIASAEGRGISVLGLEQADESLGKLVRQARRPTKTVPGP